MIATPAHDSIVQHWNDDARFQLVPAQGQIYDGAPRVGIVIGTFAAVPYIHLQLEAHRRFYPDVPLLVHDDGSSRSQQLKCLCHLYGVDFESNDKRQPATLGDLSVFVGGLQWARKREVQVLLKVSRRWVFLTNWIKSLTALALESQYATFGSFTTTFDFGFRTECVAMAVSVWNNNDFLNDAMYHIQRGRSIFVEGYIHEFARRYERMNCTIAERWRDAHPMDDDRNGYAVWDVLGTDRCERSPLFLWHDSCVPEDYLAKALEWNLPYALSDFLDPNQGAGIEP